MKNILIVICGLLLAVSCNTNDKRQANANVVYQCPMKCEDTKTYTNADVSCPVCKMDVKAITKEEAKIGNASHIVTKDESIFDLTSQWKTEEDKSTQLKDLKGKTLVIVMIYTSCRTACPLLVQDMKAIEAKVPKDNLKDVQFVLVSIDPKVDTPAHLKEFAQFNKMDDEHWTFLQGTEEGTREFANTLALKYKRISPIDFSHSNMISVFNPKGELVYQQEGLRVENEDTVAKILEVTKPSLN